MANLLCEEDVWRLTELRDNPDWKEYIPFLDTSAMPLLVKYGFAEKGLKTDGTYAIHVASDFWKAIKPCLDHLSNDFGRQLRLLTETFTEGLANLYGEISRNELVSYMDRNITGLAKVGADIVVDDVFARSMLLDDMAYTVEGFKEEEDTLEADKVAFVSRYGWYDLDAQRKAVDTKKTIAQRQTFTPKEVSDAASGNLPMIPNKLQSAFEHLLIKEMGINETLVALTCHQLWFLVQHEGDPDIHITPEQFFENATLSPYTCKADDRLKAQARQLLADYLDNMPRWSLKGYSKAELAKTV